MRSIIYLLNPIVLIKYGVSASKLGGSAVGASCNVLLPTDEKYSAKLSATKLGSDKTQIRVNSDKMLTRSSIQSVNFTPYYK